MRIVTSLLVVLALAGCNTKKHDKAAAPDVNLSADVPAPAPIASAAPAVADCGGGLTPVIDDKEFLTVSGPDAAPLAPKDLDPLKTTMFQSFRAAATQLCASRKLTPAKFAPYHHLLIRNAAGATEPNVYPDPTSGSDGLILEYAFDKSLAPAPQSEISTALLCWGDPGAEECADRGD